MTTPYFFESLRRGRSGAHDTKDAGRRREPEREERRLFARLRGPRAPSSDDASSNAGAAAPSSRRPPPATRGRRTRRPPTPRAAGPRAPSNCACRGRAVASTRPGSRPSGRGRAQLGLLVDVEQAAPDLVALRVVAYVGESRVDDSNRGAGRAPSNSSSSYASRPAWKSRNASRSLKTRSFGLVLGPVIISARDLEV